MENQDKIANELIILNQIKDSTIIELSNVIIKLTTEIERHYILRKEHEKIIKELKGE